MMARRTDRFKQIRTISHSLKSRGATFFKKESIDLNEEWGYTELKDVMTSSLHKLSVGKRITQSRLVHRGILDYLHQVPEN